MAPHPRMLFPYPSNATSCWFECSDACSFYGLCNPFLYSPPPPPPPPQQQNPTSPIRLHHSSRLSLALVASASALAAASLLLLLSCLLSLHLRRRRSASSAGADAADSNAGADADADSEAEGFVDEDGGVHHHVWYIRTVGLDEPTIGAIAVWVYRSGDGGVLVGGGGAGCAVCLAEFRDGELLRLLPKCGHAFHVACIDAWLRGHVNCPLCRAPIMAPTPAPAPAPNPALALPSSSPFLSPSSSPSSSSSSSSSSSDATISDRDGSDSGDQVGVRGIEEGTDAGDVEIGGGNSMEVDSTMELSSSSSTRVLSNSQDKV